MLPARHFSTAGHWELQQINEENSNIAVMKKTVYIAGYLFQKGEWEGTNQK